MILMLTEGPSTTKHLHINQYCVSSQYICSYDSLEMFFDGQINMINVCFVDFLEGPRGVMLDPISQAYLQAIKDTVAS